MANIKTTYTGNLGTSTEYPMSNSPILTKATPFGPTDLLTVSLSTCMATYIDFMAQQHQFTTPGLQVEIHKTMNATGTRVDAFDTIIHLDNNYTAAQQAIIEHAAKTCPVGNSLSADIKKTYRFNY